MSAVQEIEQKALALPIKERVQLAESLLDSLGMDQVWSDAEDIAEVERRERQIESGEVKPLTEGEFWARMNARPKA